VCTCSFTRRQIDPWKTDGHFAYGLAGSSYPYMRNHSGITLPDATFNNPW
jgi:hypothetical protein